MDEHELHHLRQHKDESFRHDPHSPVPAEQREAFAGLRYFPLNRDLVFDLPVEPADGSSLEIPTSDGSSRRYRRAAHVRFHVQGEQAGLVLLSREDEAGFFLPFRDATSGKQAYGAGRYLDIAPADGAQVHVDFNLAYNPYCAYNEAFSCPLPPPENWLRVPIRAGEAMYVR